MKLAQWDATDEDKNYNIRPLISILKILKFDKNVFFYSIAEIL